MPALGSTASSPRLPRSACGRFSSRDHAHRLTRLYLPGMIERARTEKHAVPHPGRGIRRGISSRPANGRLLREKAYVLHFSEPLPMNFRGRASPSPICAPVSTATEFQERANITGIRLTTYGTMDARSVAEDGYWADPGKPWYLRLQNWLVAIGALCAPANGYGNSAQAARSKGS